MPPSLAAAPSLAQPFAATNGSASGAATNRPQSFVDIDGVAMDPIHDYDRMPPFFVSVVSESDLWMFVSSRGGLTAGRVEPERCIFPYEAEDKIHTASPFTGPRTCLRVARDGNAPIRWEPFVDDPDHAARRCIYKNVLGTQLVFEETRDDLGLRFRYRWAPTDRFGFVRTAWLDNLDANAAVDVTLLDGLLNLLPAGIPLPTIQRASSLANAYTQAEADDATTLAIVALTAGIVDKAEPAEALTANVVWSHGLDRPTLALLPEALEQFRAGQSITPDTLTRNRRPAYLMQSAFSLGPGETKRWHVAADADRTQPQVVALRRTLLDDQPRLDRLVDEAIAATTDGLTRFIAAADGLQATGDPRTSAHHQANVLFNIMRGGAIASGYDIRVDDFLDFARTRNHAAAERAASLLPDTRPDTTDYHALRQAADDSADPDLIRLTLEYLPLTFGRRHGDPSRPWNMFAINIRRPDGDQVFDYQGNWRDIFQNWEALARSFPGYLPGMVAKFVNASTPDGHNPYRISRNGIDWEAPDPHDPWAHIGYWGDHQIIYLLKLLELLKDHEPDTLTRMLRLPAFAYADVPYRIKPFADILADPANSIAFDWDAHRASATRVDKLGTDGRLALNDDGTVRHATLAEKLLVPLLAKLSNLVIDGGVWMNTQRPEWNDANNALATNGLSVVTTCYLLRHACFLRDLFAQAGAEPLPVAPHVAAWLNRTTDILRDAVPDEAAPITDTQRRAALDQLGQSYEAFRNELGQPAQPDAQLDRGTVLALLDQAVRAAEHTVATNRRPDGLYHAYNLLALDPATGDARVDRLPLMLEGQVAALSTGALSPDESAGTIEALFDSDLYRPDIHTFTLYPVRDLPRYLDRNRVDPEAAGGIPLLAAMLDAADTAIIGRDADDTLRFDSRVANAADLGAALDRVASAPGPFADRVAADRQAVLDLYESTFNHHAFTGRSGTMYGYEGLGCVYWHMISKLLLAAHEARAAAASSADDAVIDRCNAAYRRVRAGLGFEKTAAQFGAFPLDPYSHTPLDRGAQQPGMTGQVKEEILTRFGELGLVVEDGRIRFEPRLIDADEFLDQPTAWTYLDTQGQPHTLNLPEASFAFTLCQVPVVVTRGSSADGRITIVNADATTRAAEGLALTAEDSAAVFQRAGTIRQLAVELPAD
ncbi:MAG: hypothetical protein AAF078_04425 [Planctomycetota bacterium]